MFLFATVHARMGSTQGDGNVDFAEFQRGFKKLKERDSELAGAPKAEHPSLAFNTPASGS